MSLGAKGLALDKAGAHVSVFRDGSVRIAIGGAEMGQGLHTVLSQIASESFGVPMEAFRIAEADTAIVPDSGPRVWLTLALPASMKVYAKPIVIRSFQS